LKNAFALLQVERGTGKGCPPARLVGEKPEGLGAEKLSETSVDLVETMDGRETKSEKGACVLLVAENKNGTQTCVDCDEEYRGPEWLAALCPVSEPRQPFWLGVWLPPTAKKTKEYLG
jgi:hypothetical protein